MRSARRFFFWGAPSAASGSSLAQGFEAWWPHDRLAVHGYVEALRHYREISAICAT